MVVELGAASKPEAAQLLREAQRLSTGQLEAIRRRINEQVFGGDLLADARRRIREAGGDL